MIMKSKKNISASSNKSGEKLLDILEFLADSKVPVRLLDIANSLGYNSSTALRFINTLQQRGYVAQESSNQRYHLTFKLCRLASKIEASNSLSAITHPFLLQLSDIYQESTCISIEDHFRMVYIDVVTEVNKTLVDFVKVGNIVPMHCTGNGKLLLSSFSDEEINRFIAEKNLVQYTEHTIITREDLMAELDRIRKNGYAEVHNEREIGMSCFSYPIYNYAGKMIAGISVTGPGDRINKESFKDKLHYLAEAASEISSLLGYIPPTM